MNHGQRLAASFGAAGVSVRSGSARLGLGLRGVGYGEAVRPVSRAKPLARANRVVYRRGAVTEWYVNGPLGLEQGFTLRSRPAGARSGPLTLAVAQPGNLSATLERGRRGVALHGAGASLRYAGLTAFDARGRELRSWLALRDGRVLVRVDDAGARYPLEIDPLVQQGKLTPSSLGRKWTGYSVAVSGDTVVAGAPLENVASNNVQGSVYVFEKPAGGWQDMTQTARLTASDGAANDQLGYAVAISGDTIVAGSRINNGSRGAVYVFKKPADGWHDATEAAKLTASDAASEDQLGFSVAVSGDTVVSGARFDDSGRGSAYVFQKPALGWQSATETAKLTASDGASQDELGYSVAVSGGTVAAGAALDDADSVSNQGSVYVFQEPIVGWQSATETAKLTAPDGVAGDVLGAAVALSGDTLVAGASGDDVGSVSNQGSAYVFQKPAGGWISVSPVAKLTASDGGANDNLGNSVAVAGDTVVAGSWDDIGSNPDQGSAYVFRKPAGGWQSATQSAKRIASDGTAFDFMGNSVGVAGDTVVAGAPQETDSTRAARGAVYVFTASNQAPSATDDTAATDEDTALTVPAPGVLANDSDADFNPITASKVSDPAHGTLSLNADGSFTYTPAADYNGPDSFTYKASDGEADSNAATVSITVRAVNDPPVCPAVDAATDEDTAVDLAPPCSDIDGDALTYGIAELPAHGTLNVANGKLRYDPDADYNGPDSFAYTANDGTADSDAATVTMTVRAVNDAPVCDGVDGATDEDTAVDVAPSCSDIDSGSLSYAVVAQPAHGTASVAAGKLHYTPAADYHGPDSFTYKANDGSADSNTASATITIRAVNDAPVCDAVDDATDEDTAVDVAPSCSDVDSGSLTYAIAGQPEHGTASVTAGKLHYVPEADYSGPDSFTYTADDGTADSDAATATITVRAVNDAPLCDGVDGATDEDTAVDVAPSCTDADADTLTYAIAGQPAHGAASVVSGKLHYTPAADYHGPDSFTYNANDGTADSNAATVTITVRAVNDAPVCSAVSGATDEDTAVDVAPSCSDADSGSLTYAIVAQPAHGKANVVAGKLRYVPKANYNGPDAFTYRATDGTTGSDATKAAITVRPVNDAPVCSAVNATTQAGTTVELSPACTDIDSGSLSYAIAEQPAHGTAGVVAGRLRYTPATGYHGADAFTYRAGDGSRSSAPATAAITVAAGAAPSAVMRVHAPSLSLFGRSRARCQMQPGTIRACRVRLLDHRRVLARGRASTSRPDARALTVRLKLTKRGRKLLARHLGGIRARVAATATTGDGTRSARTRTRAILAVEHLVTPPGSWLPNRAALSKRGRRYLRAQRSRLTAVAVIRCDGYSAKVRTESPNAKRISIGRATIACATLRRRGFRTTAVGHGDARPVASNTTPAGQARNRRVEVTIIHRRTRR